MTIQENQVVIGSFYNAGNDQLRKVVEITKDDEERNRVHYLSKSQKISGRGFNFGHTKASPPLMATFLEDCNSVLSDSEVLSLRNSNIILEDE